MKRWWRPRSIRVQLTLWYAAALTVVLVLYASGVFAFLIHSLSTELDRQIHEDFEMAEHMLEWTAEGRVRWRVAPIHEEADMGDGRWLEVWSPQGELLYRSPSSEKIELGPIPSVASRGHPIPESVKLLGNVYVRLLIGSYLVSGLPVVIRVARSEEELREELSKLLLVLGLGLPLAIGIAGLGGYALAWRVLAPVGEMADRARMITAERLGERLPVENPDDELGHLAMVFNETFARLEGSFEQMRRFTADESHELRTPLTAIRSVGEVGLREHHDESAYREIIGSMLEETDRLGRLVDSLLMLSRADAGHLRLTPERVDLAELALEVINHLGVLAEEKQQIIHVKALKEPIYAFVDRLVLRQAIINLVDNAIKYSSEGVDIQVVVREQP